MNHNVQQPTLGETVTVSELKKSPTRVIRRSRGRPVAVLSHKKVLAYMVPSATFEALIEAADDAYLASIVRTRDHETPVAIAIDEL